MAIVTPAPKARLLKVFDVIRWSVDCSLPPESFSSPPLMVCIP